MSREDPDVAAEVQRILSNSSGGGRDSPGTRPILRRSETCRAHELNIEGSEIPVAKGRIPNTAGIGLEKNGVELDGRGYIRINERLETSASEVWAISECAGSPQFTHLSVDDFRVIKDYLAGGKGGTRDRLIPYCMFKDPPLARVGLTEGEAQRQGIAALPMGALCRGRRTKDKGFMKALIGDDARILGFTMIGSEAGEVIAAMLANLTYAKLRDAVLAHPTMEEALFSNVLPRTVEEVTPKSAIG
jgi:pyruvate/2-oxoglutarate dehydrogenase complex dihydrolipoamide dehydrogenase (E3) component